MPKYPVPTDKKRTVGVRLDELDIAKLEVEAAKQGLRVSTYVRTIVRRHVSELLRAEMQEHLQELRDKAHREHS